MISRWTIRALALTASTLALAAPQTAYAADAKICFEAENPAAIGKPLVKKIGSPNKPYSGRGYLEIPWDQNKTKGIGQATYKVRVAQPGVYTLWARTYWANGCGNSVAVSVNGGGVKVLGEDGTYDKWHWVGGNARVKLKAGVNTIVLKNRETGVSVDQFYLTQDADYTPTGLRKPTA
jgi:hypothetical protein